MDLKHPEPASAVLEQTLTQPLAPGGMAGRFPWLQLFPPVAIQWNRLELPIADLPRNLEGLRLLHLTDFHLRRSWPKAYDLLLARIRLDPPDLLLLTGDFVDNKGNHRLGMPMVRKLIDGLTWRIGCYAIHGNHDSYAIGRELHDTKVIFLDGQRRIVTGTPAPVEIIGLPGKHRNQLKAKFLRSIPPREAGVPRIVLSHFPDHLKRIGELEADLVLSGHTHGGQMCLPGGIPLIWHDALPRRFARGANRVGKTWLVVSRGLGFTGLPIRMYCAPEVIEIRLRGE